MRVLKYRSVIGAKFAFGNSCVPLPCVLSGEYGRTLVRDIISYNSHSLGGDKVVFGALSDCAEQVSDLGN